MSHDLNVPSGDKQALYTYACRELRALLDDESDPTANLANATSLLREIFGWLWIGFYVVRAQELVLGPFQGPVACTRIRRGRGVCGTAWQNEQTVLVSNVEEFPGHIACSSRSKSEIVVPVWALGRVWGVLDVDDEAVGGFDGSDAEGLGAFCELIGKMIERCE